jgi:ATP-binding cassette subfamily C protein LapB
MNGRILIDGADISQFSREELSTWMGFVPQDCILFSGTVRDNIACRKLGISDDEVLRASQAAGVHHFVVDMPDGYNTEIGEAGCRLSCGERQRIAIARALVGDPPLVILDEPSSNLDYQAELELRKLLKSLGKKCTVIVVTHSPALLACCDDLVALDKGRIYVAGPSKDVLPKLFGAGADHSNSASPQLINTESQKHNKIGAMQDSSQAQTQTKATAQQKKLIAVRAVKAPPIMDTPIFDRSENEKQKEQSKLNEAQTNTPVSPDRTGGKP